MALRILVATAVLLVGAAAPAAAQYGEGATIGVSAGTAVRGMPIVVAGSGFAAGEVVSLAFGEPCGPSLGGGGAAVGSALADGAGAISTRLTIPPTARPGGHGIRAGGRSVTSCTDLAVVASADEVGSGLPLTVDPSRPERGRPSLDLLGPRGLAILLGGGLLLLVAHRRRARA